MWLWGKGETRFTYRLSSLQFISAVLCFSLFCSLCILLSSCPSDAVCSHCFTPLSSCFFPIVPISLDYPLSRTCNSFASHLLKKTIVSLLSLLRYFCCMATCSPPTPCRATEKKLLRPHWHLTLPQTDFAADKYVSSDRGKGPPRRSS